MAANAVVTGPETLQELSTALDGEIGSFQIIDTTRYNGSLPGRRTIELRSGAGLLGELHHYPAHHAYRFTFTPNGSQVYGALAKVVDALESHGVVVDRPVDWPAES